MNASKWEADRVQPGDVHYACTPFYLGSAWNGCIWPALVSGTTVAIDRSFSVTSFWDRVRYYRATRIFTLGAMHMYLWNQDPREDDADTGVTWAQCIPMSWDLIPHFKQRFGIRHMDQVYGSSETFVVTFASDDQPWHGSAMGRAAEHYDVALLDENDMPVPTGEVGEICVRPREPGVMFLGYFNDHARTVEAWRNLWHHQGDLATRDESGVFYFADRKKDYVRYAGRNIALFEVETVVDKHADIAESAAYGIPSAELETEAELALAVVLKPGRALSGPELASFINARAPYYFVPRYIDFVDSIPRNAHLRVLKDELRSKGLSANAWDSKLAGYVASR